MAPTSVSDPEPSASGSNNEQEPSKEETPPAMEQKQAKPSFLKKAWTAIGLDVPTVVTMIKGALPPVIALAAYQGKKFAAHYTTLGYLVAIMALLGMAILPRAKFFTNITLNIVFVCIGGAIALLQCQVAVSARKATTPATSSHGSAIGSSGSRQSSEYNAAASAVSGLGLFITIYIISYLRAKRPQLMFQTIIYSIFTVVASVYSPQFPDMAAAESFVKRLMETFLTGFGIAIGVHIVILPVTSRTIASKQIAGFLKLLQLALKSHTAYLVSIHPENDNVPTPKDVPDADTKDDHHHHHHLFHHKVKAAKSQEQEDLRLSAEAAAMKQALFQIAALFGKLHIEVGFAKKEFAYGKLGPEDFDNIITHLRSILLPIVGMTTFIDIMQSVKRRDDKASDLVNSSETVDAIRRLKTEEWNEVFAMSKDQFKAVHQATQGGLVHISYVLELVKKPKAAVNDIEKQDDVPAPGSAKYADYLEQATRSFLKHRQEVLQIWCEQKGIKLPSSFWDDPSKRYSLKDISNETDIRHRENQQQLYLILYLRFLTWSTGQAILEMVRFADSKVQDGSMTRNRIISPGFRRIKKLFQQAFAHDEDTDYGGDGGLGESNIYMGDALKAKKDPEHLPPATAFQRATNALRIVPSILGSPESAYAFRVAVAVLSLGILAYLRQTHAFFLKQRIMWALIMLSISMTAHAGQSVLNFVLRIVGTFIAMCGSLVIWYMCDHKPAAILPIMYLYFCGCFYVLVKFPKYIIVAILSMVTVVLIIGYELQIPIIGVTLATSNGNPYYPIYELAPYRLAAVAVGLFVAFVWTYFPYPVTTHSTLRKDLGGTLYLLGNFYSCMHTTVDMRLRCGIKTDSTNKKSPTYRLAKARHKVFSKVVIMLNKLREHSMYTKYEPTFGGKFPKKTYDELIQSMQNLFNYMALSSYSSMSFTSAEEDSEESEWLKAFRQFAGDVNITSHEMTSTLCLLSASVSNSQPLPPYLRLPRPYDLGDRMAAIDPEILSISHISQPCYAAFAVLEIASTLIAEEMGHMVKLVKELVGEVDFSFHIISTGSENSSSVSSTSALSEDSTLGKEKGKLA